MAACTPAAQPTNPPAAPSAATATTAPASAGSSGESVSLRFASWDSSSGQDVYNGIVGEFNKKFPNIKVAVEFTPDGYDNKILTGLAGGNAPDVYMWWNYPSLLAKKGIVDLTNYASRSGDQGLDLTQYYPQIIDYTKLNGVLVGTPNAFTPRAIFYNKKLFRDAGLSEPTNDWTWSQFMDTVQKLTKGDGADKVYGIYSDPSSYWLQGYVWSRGSDFISPDGKKATGSLDSPDTVEIVQRWADMVTKQKVSPTADTMSTMGGAAQMFISGKLAMMDNGRWPQTDLKKAKDLEFGLVMPPLDDKTNKRVVVLHTSAFCLNPQTKFVDQSWELAKYLGGPVGNKLFGQAGWAVPCLPSVVKELGWDTDPIEKVWIDSIPFATVKPCFQRTTVWSEADQEIANTLQAIWLGQQTAESGLKAAATKVDDILAKAPPMM
jgi:multiple sugar transport system substrate-binding protein